MNTGKAKTALHTHPGGVHEALYIHLSDHDAEEARLAKMQSDITDLQARIGNLATQYILGREPELWICENAETCKALCLGSVDHHKPHCSCGECVLLCAHGYSKCIPLSEFTRRKAEREAAELRKWEKGARVQRTTASPCNRCTTRENTAILIEQCDRCMDGSWQAQLPCSRAHVCPDCYKVVATAAEVAAEEAAKADAEAKRIWDAEAKVGAKVKIIARECARGCRVADHSAIGDTYTLEKPDYADCWMVKGNSTTFRNVCHRCAKVISPPPCPTCGHVGECK